MAAIQLTLTQKAALEWFDTVRWMSAHNYSADTIRTLKRYQLIEERQFKEKGRRRMQYEYRRRTQAEVIAIYREKGIMK